MEEYAKVLMYAIPGFLVLMGIEFAIGLRMKKYVYRSFDTISSVSSGMTNSIRNVIGLTIVIISYSWLEQRLGMFDIKAQWWLYLLAFMGLDFAGYWSHRFEHIVNIFWNRHIIHHSSEEFNLACALRQPFSNFVALFTFLLIPVAILGVPVRVIAVMAPLHLFAQFWYHTRLIDRMGFLEKIIVTPSHHRVHHAINDIYMDKNFGQIFIFWDKWFGTFQEEQEDLPPVYGVKRAVKTWNPILINYEHGWLIIRDAWRTKNWVDKFRIWFMPTGWRPADVAEKYPVEVISDPYTYRKFDTPEKKGITIWAWFQFLVNLGLMIHMMAIIADISFVQLLLYGLFLFVSIYGYTALMDYGKEAIVAEGVKLVIVGSILYQSGSWYGISQVIMGVYALLSLGLAVWFLKDIKTIQPTI